MKLSLTSAIMLALASFFVAPELAVAAPAAPIGLEAAASTLNLTNGGNHKTRRTKVSKVRGNKMAHRSSAAKAHAKRHRRTNW